jgi:iron(III) transport system substrate-binding protein
MRTEPSGKTDRGAAGRLSRRGALAALGAAVAAPLAGCGRRDDPNRVVVYSALDQEFAEPILVEYARRTGVRIAPKFDTESTKTVGLYNAILAERARPVCDLFWNNEILNTLRLKQQGRLAPFRPKNAEAFPTTFRAADGTWYGFAARARILLVNTQAVPDSERPTGILDLLQPKWRGKVGIAKPLFGTTATHAACLFAFWGTDRAQGFFRDLKANDVQVLSGNKQVAQEVGRGTIALGLTDTDDALGEIDAGSPVAIVYLDREPDQLGTLFIPNTLAVIEGAPHRQQAERLADYLLSPEVELALANGPSGQIPLGRGASGAAKLKVETPATVHAMPVDFEAAASQWDQAAAFLTDLFARA